MRKASGRRREKALLDSSGGRLMSANRNSKAMEPPVPRVRLAGLTNWIMAKVGRRVNPAGTANGR
jgi:hypothetical protein